MRPAPLPTELVVGATTYRLRRYTPKRRGAQAGHGWVRDVATPFPHGAEVGAELKALLDEIANLREQVRHLEALADDDLL